MERPGWPPTPDAPLARRLLAALRGRPGRGRPARPAVRGAAGRHARTAGTAAAATSSSTCASTTTPDPVPELIRLLDLHDDLLRRPRPDRCLPLEGDLADEVQRPARDASGTPRDDLEAALASWAGVENLEERLLAGHDRPRRPASMLREKTRVTILAIDAGTTGVTALVVTEDGADRGPRLPGVRRSTSRSPAGSSTRPRRSGRRRSPPAGRRSPRHGGDAPTAIGITNQRETAVLWDRESLAAPRRAIVWQDRRTSAICDRAARRRATRTGSPR